MLTENQLIRRCRRYNVSAQRVLYERYAPIFKRICLRYVSVDAEADDILQDSFMKIFDNIKSFKGNGSFEGWMKRIVINTALNHYRKEKRSGEKILLDEVYDTSCLGENDHEDTILNRKDITHSKADYSLVEQADISREELLDCVENIKEEFKLVFKLYFIDNMRHAEIGTLLGIDEKTSRSRLSRARQALKEELYKRSIDKISV